MTTIESNQETAFDRFLNVAREKPFSQKLLLVFAEKELRTEAELPSDFPDVETDFSVKPLMYIDKPLDEISTFEALLDDSKNNGQSWDLLYVTVADNTKVSPEQISQRLEMMIKLIHQGEVERFLIFNTDGDLAHLDKVTVQ